jgi:hypothetical protein
MLLPLPQSPTLTIPEPGSRMPNHMVRRTALVAMTAVLCCGAARVASAQVVIDPDIVEFTPSPDHLAVNKQGAEVVDVYELWFYLPGAARPFQVVGLEKPAPGNDGKIRVRYRSLLISTPPSGVLYEARVAATGPGGRSLSAPSNTFSFGGTCSYAVTPSDFAFPVAGGTTSLSVVAGAGCAWSPVSSAGWLTVGGGGTGSGTVTLTASSNATTAARVASVQIGAASVTVSQAGTSCTYSLSSSSLTVPFGGGAGSFNVSTGSSCSWSAVSNADWLALAATASGAGAGKVQFTVSVNTATSQRSGTISVGGRSFTVVQPGIACSFSLSSSTVVMAAAASSGAVSMSAPAGCTWTASSNAPWLAVVGWAGGNGLGTISFEAEENTTGSARGALIAAGGQTVSITQQAAGQCSYTVVPGSVVLPNAGGTGTLSVTAPVGCAWSASSDVDWITLTSTTNGAGAGAVGYEVSPNLTAGAYRLGHLSVAGRQVVVWQSPASCSFSLSPTTRLLPPGASQSSVDMVTATGCSWAVSTSASWLSVSSPTFASGPAPLTFAANANPSASSRTGTIVAGGKTLTVTQAGNSTCTFDLPGDRVTFGRDASTGSVTVAINGSCPLTAASDVGWLSVTAVDKATSTVTYAVSQNDTGYQRTGGLRLGSSVLSVTQKPVGLPRAPSNVRVTGQGGL